MPALIHQDAVDVDTRLARLGLEREKLLEILRVCYAEHGNCNENDPRGSAGLAVYRWAVRGLREQYRVEGWEIDRTGGLETMVHHDLKIRIAVMNTDEYTSDRRYDPQNRFPKGPNSESAATANMAFFPGAESWPLATKQGPIIDTSDYVTWHLCIFILGDTLKAELSLLIRFANGFFQEAKERIFLVSGDDWGPLGALRADDGDAGQIGRAHV